MDTTKSSKPHAHRTARRARTNRGRFHSLEARYRRGDLSPAEEEAFEATCLAIHRLYKQAR